MKQFVGIFTYRERWGMSWQGWVTVMVSIALLSLFIIFSILPFLAVNLRIKTNVLIVEGWVHDYAINAAKDEFMRGGYQHIYTTGGPVQGTSVYSNDYNTSASVGAGRLRAAGIASELVQMVPSRVVDRDRTYSSAVALREWFRSHGVHVTGINVVTEGPHARRTRLLFQKAFGEEVSVGIIAVDSPDYDPKHWWRYSEGVRDVIGESIAYIYARFLFSPPSESTASAPVPNH